MSHAMFAVMTQQSTRRQSHDLVLQPYIGLHGLQCIAWHRHRSGTVWIESDVCAWPALASTRASNGVGEVGEMLPAAMFRATTAPFSRPYTSLYSSLCIRTTARARHCIAGGTGTPMIPLLRRTRARSRNVIHNLSRLNITDTACKNSEVI